MTAYFMYVLRCADDTLYTGYTVDVQARVRTHNAGEGAKYTAARLPVTLEAFAQFATKSEAMKAEFHFKQLTRMRKLEIISQATDEATFAEALRTEFGFD